MDHGQASPRPQAAVSVAVRNRGGGGRGKSGEPGQMGEKEKRVEGGGEQGECVRRTSGLKGSFQSGPLRLEARGLSPSVSDEMFRREKVSGDEALPWRAFRSRSR